MSVLMRGALQIALMLVLPILFVGVVNRTKAIWAGRRGPPLVQSAYDLVRLFRKRPVYSEVTSELFWLGPLTLLATTLVSGFVVPILGARAPLALPFDFVGLAYLWGLGRFFLILAALDTGSSFEGMGAAREATFAAFVEPVFFLTVGSLGLATGARSFDAILHVSVARPEGLVVLGGALVALLIVLATESSRMPVDDPTTHLELTMIHEVMILDHAGPDLAAVQLATSMKMTLCAAVIASLVNPFRASAALGAAFNVTGILLIAVVVGCVESLIPRIRLRAVPELLLVGIAAALVALLAAAWSLGAPP